jgi:hypothetical protein
LVPSIPARFLGEPEGESLPLAVDMLEDSVSAAEMADILREL